MTIFPLEGAGGGAVGRPGGLKLQCRAIATFFSFILFWRTVAKSLHNSCARVLFDFIANGRSALVHVKH